MHGRVKVRTSEEEKLRKDKERHAKLQLFQNAMEKIKSKRSKGVLDRELLDLTAQLLAVNPDVYTLWNVRREVLQVLKTEVEDVSEMSKQYDLELHLTEVCLRVNPKSYCAWHQREWVLTTRSDPDWKHELYLCGLYLKYDERNFHVWDYRRIVALHHKTPQEDEFKYTTEKIHENFSNYSAWHYRSKMLIQLYPDREGGRPIADTRHKEELKIVESAAFTDPDDTSAWFYQRWLLGAVKKTKLMVVCTVAPRLITLAFNTSVGRQRVAANATILLNDVPVSGEWRSVTGNEKCSLWIMEHSEQITEDLNAKVEVASDDGVLLVECEHSDGACVGHTTFSFRSLYSESVLEELEKQLQSCHQLLKLEPDSKWTLLTTTVLMQCCDPKNSLNSCLENLTKLKHIDKLRSGYYDDLASKWILEYYLEQYGASTRAAPLLRSLHSYRITALYHMQYFSSHTEIDFSNQNLTSRSINALIFLQNCEILNLADNKITDLACFPHIPKLKKVILTGNNVSRNDLDKIQFQYGEELEILSNHSS